MFKKGIIQCLHCFDTMLVWWCQWHWPVKQSIPVSVNSFPVCYTITFYNTILADYYHNADYKSDTLWAFHK